MEEVNDGGSCEVIVLYVLTVRIPAGPIMKVIDQESVNKAMSAISRASRSLLCGAHETLWLCETPARHFSQPSRGMSADARILIGLRPANPTNESLETRKWLKSRNGAACDDASFVH